MVNKKTVADSGAWVDLDTSQPTRELCQYAGKQLQALTPQAMRNPMRPNRMQAWIGKQHFKG